MTVLVWKVFFLRDVTGFNNHGSKKRRIFYFIGRQKYSEEKVTVINRKKSSEEKSNCRQYAKTNTK
jgi:hypothetical protein